MLRGISVLGDMAWTKQQTAITERPMFFLHQCERANTERKRLRTSLERNSVCVCFSTGGPEKNPT